MGILPVYEGIICHDHLMPYLKNGGLGSLCNAHHILELERAAEQDQQKWAERMILLLKEINKAINDAGGYLEKAISDH